MNLPITNEQVSTGEKKREMGNWSQTCNKNTEFCLQEGEPRPCTSALGEGRDAQCWPRLPAVPGQWGMVAVPPDPCAQHPQGELLLWPCFAKTLCETCSILPFGGLRGCFSLLPAKSWVLLWAVHTGMCEPWGWVTAAETAACIWQRALEGTIKKLFAPQLEILIKSVSIWMARGGKGVNSVLCFPLAFSACPPHSPGCSLKHLCLSSAPPSPQADCWVAATSAPTQPIQCQFWPKCHLSSLHPFGRVRGSSKKAQGKEHTVLILACQPLTEGYCFCKGRRNFHLYHFVPALAMSQCLKKPLLALTGKWSNVSQGPGGAGLSGPLRTGIQQQWVAGPYLAGIKRE